MNNTLIDQANQIVNERQKDGFVAHACVTYRKQTAQAVLTKVPNAKDCNFIRVWKGRQVYGHGWFTTMKNGDEVQAYLERILGVK